MVSPEAKEIGNICKEAREKLGMSVEEANKRSRIHINVINDIESGVFDRLGKLYLKSFLKKYAAFLNLDAGSILEKFDGAVTQIPETEFDPDIKEKEDEGKTALVSEKTIQFALIGIFSAIIIILIFVLGGKMGSKISQARQARREAVVQPKKAAAEVVKTKKAPAISPRQEKTVKPTIKPSVTLTLESRGEAWVKVMEGENTLFVGILRRGDKKTWETVNAITVWTGRAEMLDFTVNNHKAGKIADGVIKNIKISKEGITINGNWVTRF
jgi:cytoskeletal protein RodZ